MNAPTLRVAAAGVLALGLCGAAGCAAGRGPGGEIIVGWDVAKLPETVGEAVNAASGFLPPPFNYLATAAAGLITAGVVGKSSKSAADTAWNDATGEHAARLEGILTARLPGSPGGFDPGVDPRPPTPAGGAGGIPPAAVVPGVPGVQPQAGVAGV